VPIAGALAAGTGGGVPLVTVGAAMSSEHPRAFLEGNVVASLCSVAAPALVAAAIAIGVGWEAGLAGAVAGLAVLALALGRAPLGAAETGTTEAQVRDPLPRAFWRRWLVLFGVVAAEFAVIYWAGSFLEETAGLGAASAVAGAGLFNLGMLAGRFAGSRMAVAVRAPAAVLQGGVLFGLAGVLLVWLGPGPVLKLAGLLLAGLGAANTFPTGFNLALAAAPGRSDQASARVMLAGGSAILLAPLALAALGDLIGLTTAFGVVPALLVATLALARWANRRPLASTVDVHTHAHDPARARAAR
jgi:predicted MFS family arabinose efflux permease